MEAHKYQPFISKQKKRVILNDFYNTKLSLDYIARKNQTTLGNVRNLVKEIDPVSVPKQKDYAVIKLESKWIEGIKQLLESRNIPFEIPENFELTEIYESKINQ